jgi:hypothetical protein
MATHAQRQKAYRERQGWAGRRKDRDRKRALREASRTTPSVTIATSVRDARKPPRDIPETHYETDDEAWEREHAHQMRPPPVHPRPMEPEPEVVIPDVIPQADMGIPIDLGTVEERRSEFEKLKAQYNVTLTKPNIGGRAAPETHPQLLEIEME